MTMSIAPMRLPAWLDVTLEGGVLALQRALAGCIELRAQLRGNWQRRALDLAGACEEALKAEAQVETALRRARNRAQLEKRAKVVLPLVERVELERKRLLAELEAFNAQPADDLLSALRLAADRAREAGWFEGAWRKFHRERSVFAVLMVAGLTALPVASWLHGSFWGAIPVLFDLRELGKNALFWVAMAAAGGLTGQAWRRLAAWKFLGVRQPSLAAPSVISVGAAAIGFYFKLPPAAVGAFLAIGLTVPLALTTSGNAWFAKRATPPLLPGDAPSPPALAETPETSQPAASTPVAERVRSG